MARVRDEIQRLVGFFVDDNLIIEFDATINEDHQGDAEVTGHPVEEGADISDHIRGLPETLVLQVVVTDTPVDLSAGPAVVGGDNNNRAQEAFEAVRNLRRLGQVVRVNTQLRDYPIMAITSHSVSRDKDTSRIVDMSIGLKEVLVAITEQVDAPTPIPKKRPRKKKEDQGKKNMKEKPRGGFVLGLLRG